MARIDRRRDRHSAAGRTRDRAGVAIPDVLIESVAGECCDHFVQPLSPGGKVDDAGEESGVLIEKSLCALKCVKYCVLSLSLGCCSCELRDAANESGHRARPSQWPSEMERWLDDAMASPVDLLGSGRRSRTERQGLADGEHGKRSEGKRVSARR